MWVLEAGNRACFQLEAVNKLLIEAGMRRQDFDGYIAVNILAVALVYSCHTALTEQFGDLIAAEFTPDE
jgi:hypothetical protein